MNGLAALLAALAAVFLLDAIQRDDGGRLGALARHFDTGARARGVVLPAQRLVAGGAMAVGCLTLLMVSLPLGWVGPLLAATLLGSALALPLVLESQARGAHLLSLRRQLPVFLRSWAIGLDGGADLRTALQEATARAPEPIGLEGRRVLLAVRIGKGTVAEVMNERGQDLHSTELAEVAGTLAAVERTGAPLAELLRRLAQDMEVRLDYRDQMGALSKGPVVQLVLIWPISVGLLVALQEGPSMTGLGETPGLTTGHWGVGLGSLILSSALTAYQLRRRRFME